MPKFYFQLLDRQGLEISRLTRIEAETEDEARAEAKRIIRDTPFKDDVKMLEICEDIENEPLGMTSVVATYQV